MLAIKNHNTVLIQFLFRCNSFKAQMLLILHRNPNNALALEFSAQKILGDWIFDISFNGPTQGPRTEFGIVSFVNQKFLGRRFEFQAAYLSQICPSSMLQRVQDRRLGLRR